MSSLLELINRNRAKVAQAQETEQRASEVQGGAFSTIPPGPARIAPNAAAWTPPGAVRPEDVEVAETGQVSRLFQGGVLDVSSGVQNALAAAAQAVGADNVSAAAARSAQLDQERAAKLNPEMMTDIDEIGGEKGGIGTYIGQNMIRGLPTLGAMGLGGIVGGGLKGVAAASAALNTGDAYGQLSAAAKTPEQRAGIPSHAFAAGGFNAILDTLGFGFAARMAPVSKLALAKMLPTHVLQAAAVEGGTGAAQQYANIVATKHLLENPDLFGLTPEDVHALKNAAAAEASAIAPLAVGGHLAHLPGQLAGQAVEGIQNFRNRGDAAAAPEGVAPEGPEGPSFTQRAGDAAGAAFRGDFAPAREMGRDAFASARENIPGVDAAINAGQEFAQRAKPGVDEFMQKARDSATPEGAVMAARQAQQAVRSTADKVRESAAHVKTLWEAAQKTQDPNVKKSGFSGRTTPEQDSLFKTFKELAPFAPDDDNRFAAKVVDGLINDNKRFDTWLAEPAVRKAIGMQFDMTPDEFKQTVLTAARDQTLDTGRPARGGYDITDSAHLFEDNALEGNDARRGGAIMHPQLADMLNEHGSLNDSGARNPHMNAERFTQFLATKRDARKGRGAGSQVRVAITRTPRDPDTMEPTGEPETVMHLVNMMNLAKAWGVGQREMGVMDKERGESVEKRDRLNVVDGVAAMLSGWEETSQKKDPKTGKFTKYTVDVRPVKIGEGDKPYIPEFDKWLPPDAVVGFSDGKQVTWGEMQERAKANAPVGATSAVDSHFAKVGQQRERQMERGDKYLDRKFGSAVTEHYDSIEALDAARLEFGRSKAEKQREALAKLDGTEYLSDADLARGAGADRAVRSIVNDILGGPDGVLSTMEPEARGSAVSAAQKFIEDNTKTPFTDAVHEMLHVTDVDSVNWVPELARDEIKTGLERMARTSDKEAFREAVDETDRQATLFDRVPSPELRRSMREQVQEDPLNKALSAEYAGLMLRSVYQELVPHVAKGVPPAIALLPSEIRHAGRAELAAQLGRLELRTGHDNMSEQEQSVDSPSYNDDNKEPEKAPYQDYTGMTKRGVKSRADNQLREDAYAKLEEIYNRPGMPEITKQQALKVRDMLDSLPEKALRTILNDKFNASDLGKIVNAPKYKVDRLAPGEKNKFNEVAEEARGETLTPFVGPEKPLSHRMVERDAQYQMHFSKKLQALKDRMTMGQETDKRNYRQNEDGTVVSSKPETLPYEKKQVSKGVAGEAGSKDMNPRVTNLGGASPNRFGRTPKKAEPAEAPANGKIFKSAYSQKLHDELGNEGFAATHDSPHRFDGKFNWREHSFKGEGAQSFGAGTYLSTANGVHRSYKRSFTAKSRDETNNEVIRSVEAAGIDARAPLTEQNKAVFVQYQEGQLRKAKTELEDMRAEWLAATNKIAAEWKEAERTGNFDDLPDPPDSWEQWGGVHKEQDVAQIERVLNSVRETPIGGTFVKPFAASPTYHLSVNAHNHEIMDWDKPFSEQSRHVQMALESFGFGSETVMDALLWEEPDPGVRWVAEIGTRHAYRITKQDIPKGGPKGSYWVDYFDRRDRDTAPIGGFDTLEEAQDAVLTDAQQGRLFDEAQSNGEEMYRSLSHQLGGDRAASEALQAAGIIGHRYAAGGGKNDVHPNYVIYDDRRIQTNAVEFTGAKNVGSILDTTDPVKQKELIDAIQKITGQKIGVAFDASQAHEGQYDSAKKMVTLAAMTGFSHSNAFHEAFHAVSQHYLSSDQRKTLWKAFRQGAIRQQIKKLLEHSPDAWESAKKDPEEMMAYGFQFWHADMLNFGRTPDSTVGKIFDYLLKKFNEVNDWLRDRPGAQELLKSIKDGAFADGGPTPVEIAAAKAARPNARIRQVTKALFEGFDKLHDAMVVPYDDRLREMGNPHIDALARAMYTQVGEKTGKRGFAQEVPLQVAKRMNVLDKLARSNPLAYAKTLAEKAQGLPETNADMHKAVRGYLAEIEKYAKDAGVVMGHVEDYLPMSWDGNKIAAKRKDFIAMMKNHEMELKAVGFTPEEAADKMSQRGTATGEFVGPIFDENGSPTSDHKLDRVFTFLSNAERAPFVRDDLASSMTRYTKQMVKRAEWARKFGDDNSKWNALIEQAREYGLTKEDEELVNSYKEDAFGLRLHDMNPTARKAIELNTVYQNYRVLSLSLLSNLVDPFGVAVRSGDWGEAWNSYKLAASRMFKSGRLKHAELQELAETIGTIERAGVQDSIHQQYGGVEIEGSARIANDALFRFNGMDGLTRSVRLAGLAAATRFLKHHAGLVGKGGDTRHLDELGVKVADIQLNAAGQLKVLKEHGLDEETSNRVQAALNRFVDEAVLRPNIGERTKWGANPYLAPLYHLKQYVFSFNKVINKKLEHEFVEHDNATPYAMASVYIPIMAVTAMLRDGITHGGSIPENNGFMHYLGSGISRSGLMGPKEPLGIGDFNDVRSLGGPTVDQSLDFATAIANPHNTGAFTKFVKESLPGGNIWGHY